MFALLFVSSVTVKNLLQIIKRWIYVFMQRSGLSQQLFWAHPDFINSTDRKLRLALALKDSKVRNALCYDMIISQSYIRLFDYRHC